MTNLRNPTTPAQRNAVLEAVVAALGGTVTRRPDTDSWTDWLAFKLPEPALGLWMHYHDERKGDYLHVSVDWPSEGQHGAIVTGRDAEYGASNPDMNVSATKPAAQIAREIQRRLIPEAARLYAKAQAMIDSRQSYAAKVAANMQALAAAAGGVANKNSYNDEYTVRNLPDGIYLKHVNEDEVRLEITLSVGAACAIIRDRAKTKAAA